MVGVPFNPRQPTGLVDTSHAAANAAQDPLLSLYLAQNGRKPAEAKPDLAENLARAAGQGLTFGWGDELLSLSQAGFDQLLHGDDGKDFWQRYDSNVARERRNLEAFRQENPIAAYGAEILGSLPTALFTGGPAQPPAWVGSAQTSWSTAYRARSTAPARPLATRLPTVAGAP
jgi:hypothetical protein